MRLETDRASARFTVVCTHDVLMCAHCVNVLGPASHSVEQFASADVPHTAVAKGGAHASACSDRGKMKSRVYEGKVLWDEAYRGIVRISLESSRCEL